MASLSFIALSGIAVFALFVGALVGVVGIGGILLIPALVYVGGIDIHTVIPACMAGFIVSGWVASYCYARRGSIRWDKAILLIAGAAPGAYLGSITVWAVSSIALETVVAAFAAASGINTLRKPPAQTADGLERIPNYALIGLGLAVGYGSSVSGTGGPLLLVPALLLLRFPTLTAIGLSMAIQLVIAPFATFGHVLHGAIDWILAVPIAIGMSLGVIFGAGIAHRISTDSLRRVAAYALIGSAVLVVAQIAA